MLFSKTPRCIKVYQKISNNLKLKTYFQFLLKLTYYNINRIIVYVYYMRHNRIIDNQFIKIKNIYISKNIYFYFNSQL